MYRLEMRRTSGFGTAGRKRTIAESTRLTGGEILRAVSLAPLELEHQSAQERVQLALLVGTQRGGDECLVRGSGPQCVLPDLVARGGQLHQHAASVVREGHPLPEPR